MLRAQASQKFEAVDSRQPNIEHDQVERSTVHCLQRGFAAVNGFRIVTVLGQRRSDLPRDGHLIFNNQNSHGFVKEVRWLKTDGKLGGQQMIVLIRASGLMLETVLQL